MDVPEHIVADPDYFMRFETHPAERHLEKP